MNAATTRCPALVEPKPLPTKDRRKHARHLAARLCKVYQPATGRYSPARTIDLSAGGALLEINMPRPLEPGDEIDVALAWVCAGVLEGGSMIRARVVRVQVGEEGRRVVAVEYARPVEERAAA